MLLKRAAALARPLACPPAVIAGARRSEPALEKGNFPSGADARVQLGFKRVRDLNEVSRFNVSRVSLKSSDSAGPTTGSGLDGFRSGRQRSLKTEGVFLSGGLSTRSFASLLH